MKGARDPYEAELLALARSTSHRRSLRRSHLRARLQNPVCGDKIDVALKVEEGIVLDFGWTGTACLLGAASAALMGELVTGCSLSDAARSASGVARYLEAFGRVPKQLQKLQLFRGVARFPARRDCVALPWRALEAALTSQ